MLFEMIFLLPFGFVVPKVFAGNLKFFGWYGLSDTFTKTWSGGLSCRFLTASYCCRWLQIIFISGLFFDSDCFWKVISLCITSGMWSLVVRIYVDVYHVHFFVRNNRRIERSLMTKCFYKQTAFNKTCNWSARRAVKPDTSHFHKVETKGKFI